MYKYLCFLFSISLYGESVVIPLESSPERTVLLAYKTDQPVLLRVTKTKSGTSLEKFLLVSDKQEQDKTTNDVIYKELCDTWRRQFAKLLSKHLIIENNSSITL